MRKNHIITVSLALLALGSLASPVYASSPAPAQPAQSNPHLDGLIKSYNEKLKAYPDELPSLRVAPSRGRVANELPLVLSESHFSPPRQREASEKKLTIKEEEYSAYEAYGSAQEDLLHALAMARYESEQQQEALWQRTLAENEALKAKYPLPAQKITDRVALVDEVWRREQARPQAERESNYAAALKEREEDAKKLGMPLFHQQSPAMQELLLEYLYLSLESEIEYLEHATDIELHQIVRQSWLDSLKILKSLDASKLDDKQRADLGVMIELTEKVAAALAKTTDKQSMERCFEELDYDKLLEKHNDAFKIVSFWDRAAILHSVLNHLDLSDYYFYCWSREMGQRAETTDPRILCEVNRHALDAIKKAMAEQVAR